MPEYKEDDQARDETLIYKVQELIEEGFTKKEIIEAGFHMIEQEGRLKAVNKCNARTTAKILVERGEKGIDVEEDKILVSYCACLCDIGFADFELTAKDDSTLGGRYLANSITDRIETMMKEDVLL